ncbi:ROK family protein [Microbacterium sp. CH12i]|uniref:ROK family protein n=1 Tax=Microbacterium sp. CH12i TaxID=1479651 RepID=UPI000B1550AE
MTANPDVIAIGVNPEVDAIEIGAISLGGGVRERIRIELDSVPSAADAVAAVVRVVNEWQQSALKDCRLVGVGVAVPGLVRASDGVVRLAPHLGWHDEDIAAPLSEALRVTVAVDNDASLGARAEWLFGAAREHRDVIYLNGGASGIGGGLILDDRLIGGAGGYAGEWGQTRPGIPASGDRVTMDGVLEDEVNRALVLQAAGLGAVDDATFAQALAASEDKVLIARCNGRDVFSPRPWAMLSTHSTPRSSCWAGFWRCCATTTPPGSTLKCESARSRHPQSRSRFSQPAWAAIVC